MPENQPGNGQSDTGQYDFQSAFTDAAASAPPQDSASVPEEQAPPVTQDPPYPPEQQPPSSDTDSQSSIEGSGQPLEQGEAPAFSLSEAAAQIGLDVTDKSEQEIARQLIDQYQQLRPYAEWGQQIAPYADQIQEYFASQQGQQGQADPRQEEEVSDQWTPEDYFKQAWREPQWDEQYDLAEKMGIVQRNPESGLYEAVPGREAMAMPLLGGMNQAMVSRQQLWQQITNSNPYQHFYEKLLEPMKRAWQADMENLVEERFSGRDTRSYVDDFEQQNSDWIYSQGQGGQRVLTDKGAAFQKTIAELRESGISDPVKLLNLAKRMVDVQPPQSQPQTPSAQSQPPQPPQQPPAPSQPQSTPEEASESKQASFLQNAMDKARHNPSSGGYAQSTPDDPVNVGENELNSMFVSEFKNSGATG